MFEAVSFPWVRDEWQQRADDLTKVRVLTAPVKAGTQTGLDDALQTRPLPLQHKAQRPPDGGH